MLREIFHPQNYYWNPWAIPNMIAGFYCLLLGVFSFFKNRKLTGRYFFLMNISIFLWQCGYAMDFLAANERVADFWSKVVYFGVTYICINYLNFTLCMIRKEISKIWNILFYFVMSGFLLAILRTDLVIKYPPYKFYWGYYAHANVAGHSIFLFVFWILVFYGIVQAFLTYRKSNLIAERQTIKMIVMASVAGFSAWVDFLANYGLVIYPFGWALICISNTMLAYAMIRYRLMEIDTVIHKTLLWLATIILLLVPLGTLGLVFKGLLFRGNDLVNIAMLCGYILFCVIYYNYFRPRIDRLFRRRKYDYQTILGKVAERIAATIDIKDLTQNFLTEICETMYLRKGVLYLSVEGKDDYVLIGRRGYQEESGKKHNAELEIYAGEQRKTLSEDKAVLSYNSSLCKWLVIHREILEKAQVEVDSRYAAVKQDALSWFNNNDLELAVPLVYEDKLPGILGLGRKENLQAYTLKDLELLKKLGREVGVTFFNALHYKDLAEKERMDEEMKMGRQIQMSLLPQEIPQVSGLNIQGLMQPAKEIGGDYYDFITLPDKENLTIVIGDVSGKGVAAGLLMSMAKATIHTLSKEGFMPREILLRTNQFLYQHIGGQKFMTLLYLLWQSQTKTLVYSSAGHEHILIFHSVNGEVEAIISGGFMLGMIEDVDMFLEEKQVQLQSHDKILLYTDGVTEAENASRDRFGLERLKETFAKHSQKPANELMQAVKGEVYSFIGDHPQYDDITLVVMEAT